MKIHVDSNFVLLGVKDVKSIDLEGSETTLKKLLEALSRRSPESLKFLQGEGKYLSPGWNIDVNSRPYAQCQEGLETVLIDGDRVAIRLELLAGG
jgi:hypothetical protein